VPASEFQPLTIKLLFSHFYFPSNLKFSLLLLLLLPLHSFAQSGPRNTMQQNQQSRQYFNQSMNQRTQDFQMRQLQKNRPSSGAPQMSPEARQQAQARQQQAEQEANEKLARFAQEQQRQHQEHPAQNPQQAAAQQQEDERQLALLALKNYRDVFLPGQLANALQARQLSPKGERALQGLNESLLDKAWWSKQPAAPLSGKIKAYSDTLTALTAGLLGFDLASPPPTPAQLSSSRIDEMLAKGSFDQKAATQIMLEVATAEKLIAGKELAKAVMDFQTTAASQELHSDPKKLQKEVKASLHEVNTELQRYHARIVTLSRLNAAQKIMHKSTSTYLARNGK
jgi:hypothetical protein